MRREPGTVRQWRWPISRYRRGSTSGKAGVNEYRPWLRIGVTGRMKTHPDGRWWPFLSVAVGSWVYRIGHPCWRWVTPIEKLADELSAEAQRLEREYGVKY